MKKFYRIIEEDESIVLLHKEANVLSVEDRFDPSKPNMRQLLIRKYGAIFPVHRLDQGTSGLMIFAKTAEAHSAISEQFQNHQVRKCYHALCLAPQEDQGTIHIGIKEHQSKKGRYITSQEGKDATSHYKVLQRYGQYALIEVEIETGRTHQIRVHLKHIGAPLMTDSKYGLQDEFYLSDIKRINLGRDQIEKPLLSRTSLHAFSLQFTHPVSKRSVQYKTPYPKDFKAVIYQLSKVYNKFSDRI